MPPKKQDPEARYPGITEMLGRVPDAVIATKYEISRTRVYQMRKDRGIPAAIQRTGSTARPTFRNAVFRELRDLWLAEEHGRQVQHLAEVLGVASRRLSDWGSGTDGRQPSIDLLVTLASHVGRQLVLDEFGIIIRKRKIVAASHDLQISRGRGEVFA